MKIRLILSFGSCRSAHLDSDVGCQNLEMPADREPYYLSNCHLQCQFQACILTPTFWERPLLLLPPSLGNLFSLNLATILDLPNISRDGSSL